MIYIYLDESGDLGFDFEKKKPSKYFVIGCIRVDSEEVNRRISKILKKIRSKKLKKKYKDKPEMKFSNTSPRIRKQILKLAVKENITVFSIIIDKRKTKQHLQKDRTLLYSFLIKSLFEQTFKQLKKEKLIISIDRMLSQSSQEVFKTYILTQHEDLLYRIPKIEITHDNSTGNKGLQIVDFIIGAIAQKYESGNLEYYNLIKKVIESEKKM